MNCFMLPVYTYGFENASKNSRHVGDGCLYQILFGGVATVAVLEQAGDLQQVVLLLGPGANLDLGLAGG